MTEMSRFTSSGFAITLTKFIIFYEVTLFRAYGLLCTSIYKYLSFLTTRGNKNKSFVSADPSTGQPAIIFVGGTFLGKNIRVQIMTSSKDLKKFFA